MKKTPHELRLERAVDKKGKVDGCNYKLLYNENVNRLGKKIATFITKNVINGFMDTQDLYITYKKNEYIIEVSVYEADEDGIIDIGISAMPLLSYIYQYGNYDSLEDFRTENEEKIVMWNEFCEKYYY